LFCFVFCLFCMVILLLFCILIGCLFGNLLKMM
jgi:hypothetical protein